MKCLTTIVMTLALGLASGWGQSRLFDITLEQFVGDPSTLDIQVRVYTAGTDSEWPDSSHRITTNPGRITVSLLEPGFYDVYIRADRFLRRKVAAVAFGEPGPVDAHATGATQITVFWPEYVGATGYYVYRALTPDGFDFNSPLNTTPVNVPTYEGSFFRWYTDTGLTPGQTYYYAVRAVRSGNPPLLSDAGEPGYDAPSSGAVPWHTRNPAQVILALRALAPAENGSHPMTALAPDGTVYDSRSSTLWALSGYKSPDTNVIDSELGLHSVLHPVRLDAPDPDNSNSGPYRRVVAQAGYRKCQLLVRLPRAGGVAKYPKDYSPLTRKRYTPAGVPEDWPWSSSDDVPYVYLGLDATSADGKRKSYVDAGLRYVSTDDYSVHTVWQIFMFVKPNLQVELPDQQRRHSYFTLPEPGSMGQRINSVDGIATILLYMGERTQPAPVPGRAVFLKVQHPNLDTGAWVYQAPIVSTPLDGSKARLRRVVSIAQTFRDGHPDQAVGYVLGSVAQHSKLDLSMHHWTQGLPAIFDCALWTRTAGPFQWDYTRLDPSEGLRWFPKGPGKDHIVDFSRKDQGISGVMNSETVIIQLRP